VHLIGTQQIVENYTVGWSRSSDILQFRISLQPKDDLKFVMEIKWGKSMGISHGKF